MWTKENVKELAKATDFHCQFTSGELNSLHGILSGDEECYGMCEGMLKKPHSNKSSGYGIAVLTSKRFLFYYKGLLGTVTTEEFPLDNISSISFHKGLLTGSLHVYATNVGEIIIEACDNGNAATIIRVWRHLSELQKIFQSDVEPGNISDPAMELEKWHSLKEKGIITEEEFNEKKKQLLGL